MADPTPVASTGRRSNEPGVDVGWTVRHPFIPFTLGDQVICAEAVDGRCCGKAEEDHPFEEDSEEWPLPAGMAREREERQFMAEADEQERASG